MADRDGTSEQPANDEPRHWVFLVESDAAALAKANRRSQTLMFIVLAAFLTGIFWVWWVDPPEGQELSLPLLVPLWIAGLLLTTFLCFRVQGLVPANEVWIGGDFITVLRSSGRHSTMTTARYKDFRAVSLTLSKGEITGATIRAGAFRILPASYLKHAATVVRAILDQGPADVKWRRKGRPFARLRRDTVKALIDRTGPPDLDVALPTWVLLGRADDMFPKSKRGYKGTHCVNMLALQPRTPVSHYVGLMLLQMFEAAPATRVLKRSEPLPVLTFREDTAEPPPLEGVLNHLRTKFGLDSKPTPGPVERTMPSTIQGVPCSILCRFDDDADECCRIRLERKDVVAS